MDDTPIEDPGLDRTLRFLRTLVTTLTVTTILGLIILIAVIVMRVQQGPRLPLPDQIALPAGAQASAVTHGEDWLGVVTTDGRFLVFDPDGRTLLQELVISVAD